MAEIDLPKIGEGNASVRRSPGRPPADAGPRRHTIIVAATELFIANGYRGTTIDDIARRASLNKRTIYALIGGKEQVFREACRRVALDSGLELDAAIDPSSLRNSLLTLGRRLVENSLAARTIALEKTAIAAARLFPDFIDQLVSSNYDEANARVAAFFERLRDFRLLSVDDAYSASELFFDLVIGQIAHRMVLGQNCPAPDDAYLQRRVDMFMKCCGADEG